MYNWYAIFGIVFAVIIVHGMNFDFVYGDDVNMTENKLKTLEFSKLNNREILPIQYLDIFQTMADKHSLLLDNKNYTVYSALINLDTSIYDYNGKVSTMSVEPNKNSILIHFYNILQSDSVELRFSNELIPIQNNNFTIYVDGIEKGYSIATQNKDIIINFIIPQGTQQVELTSTENIPEFGSLAGMIIGVSIIGIILISSKFGTHLSQNNS